MQHVERTNGTMDMAVLTDRCERLIDGLANAIMSTAETAAERIELASRVAQARQRMAAHASVLESIAAQKEMLLERAENCEGALKVAFQHQIEVLAAQEMGILTNLGVDGSVAGKAIEMADDGKPEGTLYRRQGRRFVSVSHRKA